MFLVWVYYSAQILFFGAELTQAYAHVHGSRIVPDEDAMPLTEDEQAEQGTLRTDGARESRKATRPGTKRAGRLAQA